MSLRSVYYSISPKSRFIVRKIYYYPIDVFEFICGRKNKYVSNKGDIFIGSGDFLAQGKHHLELLINMQSLRKTIQYSILVVG